MEIDGYEAGVPSWVDIGSPDPQCAVCAPGVPFPGYIDYAAFCRGG